MKATQWWTRALTRRTGGTYRHTAAKSRTRNFRPFVEPLEDRRLMAVITVTTTSDAVDNSDGVVSLREAIMAMNNVGDLSDVTASGSYGTNDEIRFQIDTSGTGVATIGVTGSGLDAITVGNLFINGQGAKDSNGIDPIKVVLNGSAAGDADGLVLQSGGNTISGLVIQGFHDDDTDNDPSTTFGHGILIDGGEGSGISSNLIVGNYIGTDDTGESAVGNSGDGVFISRSDDNTVQGNVISGNGGNGVNLDDSASFPFHVSGNLIADNFIGTNKDGSLALGNDQNGVYVHGVSNAFSADHNTITGNVIAANGDNGIFLEGGDVHDNLITSNRIGTDATGTLTNDGSTSFGNGLHGVYLLANDFGPMYNNYIGGTSTYSSGELTGEGNLISNNRGDGVRVEIAAGSDGSAYNNYIRGNFIGTDITGQQAFGNNQGGGEHGGVSLINVGFTQVGGTLAKPNDAGDSFDGNLISGNAGDGVYIAGNGESEGPVGNAIIGNLIGTDITGGATAGGIGNSQHGVHIVNGVGHQVGGGRLVPGGSLDPLGNVISENSGDGVRIEGLDSYDNAVQGNFIGTDIGGTLARGNVGAGVLITGGAYGNVIGGQVYDSFAGDFVSAGNLISANARGVVIEGGPTLPELIGDWLLNGDTTDNSGNGLDGVIEGPGTVTGTTDRFSNANGALDFNNGWIRVADNPLLQVSSYSISLWFSRESSGLGPFGVMFLTSKNFENYEIQVGGSPDPGADGIRFIPADDHTNDSSNVLQPPDADFWYHVVVTFDQQTQTSRIYVDGTLRSETTFNGNPVDVTGDFLIGNRADRTDLFPHDGKIDDVQFYAGVLSPQEVDRLAGDQPVGSRPGNLVSNNFIGTRIDGTSDLGNTGNGVELINGAAGNTVIDNVISGNDDHGVYLGDATSNAVQRNFIGTDYTGTATVGNTNAGVYLDVKAFNNTVGGSVAGAEGGTDPAGNVISGNAVGVEIAWDISTGGPNNNTVTENYIGTDVNGTAPLGNGVGVRFLGDDATIDDASAVGGFKNLIAANDVAVEVAGDRNTVARLRIGDDNDGNALGSDLENGVGLLVSGTGNHIGTPSDANVIYNNYSHGIWVTGADNILQHNFIGIDSDGTSIMRGQEFIGNGGHGVLITGANNIVGGMSSPSLSSGVDGNLISNNGAYGVAVQGSGATGNVIAGNFIGTDISGTQNKGNSAGGVLIRAADNTVGVAFAGEDKIGIGNLISGNGGNGVDIRGPNEVINGSFELGDIGQASIPGWDANLYYIELHTNLDGRTASDGKRFVELDSDGYAAIRQTITTVPGQQYTLTFDFAARPFSGVNQAKVYFGSFDDSGLVDLVEADADVSTDWTTYTYTLTATSDSTDLIFEGFFNSVVDTLGNLIDNVHLERIDAGPATGNVVNGNYIGTDVTGFGALGNSGDGVNLTDADANLVTANAISANGGNGVSLLYGSDGNRVTANHIGTFADGTAALGNSGSGVAIVGSNANTVGGDSFPGGQSALSGVGNVISANGGDGVAVDGDNNVIQGNYIGTDITGFFAADNLGNGGAGVHITGGTANLIGGTLEFDTDANNVRTGTGNLISNNNGPGVWIEGAGTSANSVSGNLIGTDATGTQAKDGLDNSFGNGDHGVVITSSSFNEIGGGTSTWTDRLGGAGNVISNNSNGGVYVSGNGVDQGFQNKIAGNFIGTDATGAQALGNFGVGVELGDTVINVVGAGGTNQPRTDGNNFAGNLISANTDDGVRDTRGSSTYIQGNIIGLDVFGLNGTDASGDSLGNGGDGVELNESGSTHIGGYSQFTTRLTRDGNVIGNNAGYGVNIGSGSSGADLRGNFIGVGIDGATALGNGSGGVLLNDAGNNYIGDVGRVTTGGGLFSGNVIAGNLGHGVTIQGSGSTGNLVAGNIIGSDITASLILGANGLFLGNRGDGVHIDSANGNIVGGVATSSASTSYANIIRYNQNDGVELYNAHGTLVQGNTIESNGIQVAQFSQPFYGLNIPAIIGALTKDAPGYLGFTGGTGGLAANQQISNFKINGNAVNLAGGQFNSAAGGLSYSGSTLTLTDDANQANSAFFDALTAAQLANFTVTFDFLIQDITNPGADGFTFAIAAANTYLGDGGSFLGYGNGGGQSIALKFDIYQGFTFSPFNLDPSDNNINLYRDGNLPAADSNSIHVGALNFDEGLVRHVAIAYDLDAEGQFSVGISGLQIGYGVGVHISGDSGNNTVGGTTDPSNSSHVGNVISLNHGEGVLIEGGGSGSAGNLIAGNFIGTTADGGSAAGNDGDGVAVYTNNNSIGYDTTSGGTVVGVGNLISANGGDGVYLDGSGNYVRGNKIGTNLAGSSALGNAYDGVGINSNNNTVGGGQSGQGNLISGNGGDGIYIDANSIVVQGNTIGTDVNGSYAIGNAYHGVEIYSSSNVLVGGSNSGEGNLISGNGNQDEQYGDGIGIFNSNSNIVRGNTIGTNRAGTAKIGNAGHGVEISPAGGEGGSSDYNTVGGAGTYEGNLISGNGLDGVAIFTSSYNVVQGNKIGTSADGVSGLGNGANGVEINYGSAFYNSSAAFNTVGGLLYGSSGGEGNLISGNGGHGILIADASNDSGSGSGSGQERSFAKNGGGCGTSDNLIQGNLIGLNVNGSGLGNAGHGVLIQDGSSNNKIGEFINPDNPNFSRGNLIAYNGGDGVAVVGAKYHFEYNEGTGEYEQVLDYYSTNNAIVGNAIYLNGDLRIDLENDGVTPNDDAALDADEGPNTLQNYFDWTLVSVDESQATFTVTLYTQPGSYYFEFWGTNADGTVVYLDSGRLDDYTGDPTPFEMTFTIDRTLYPDVTFVGATVTLIDGSGGPRFRLQIPGGGGEFQMPNLGSTSEFSGITFVTKTDPENPPGDPNVIVVLVPTTQRVATSPPVLPPGVTAAVGSINTLVLRRDVDAVTLAQFFSKEPLADSPGEIHGKLFDDINALGQPNAATLPLAGYQVYLDTNGNGQFDEGEPLTVTNDRGEYSFTGLRAGQYAVRPLLGRNDDQTFSAREDNRVELRSGAMAVNNVDLGIRIRGRRATPRRTSMLNGVEAVPLAASPEELDRFWSGRVDLGGAEAAPALLPPAELSTPVVETVAEGPTWWQWLTAAVVVGPWFQLFRKRKRNERQHEQS